MIVCPACSEENPGNARFCVACGRALRPGGDDGDEARKLVTILFVELVGLRATGGRTGEDDPEDLRRLLDPYQVGALLSAPSAATA